MPMFRPKVREVEAHQWDGSLPSEIRMRQWLGYAFVEVRGDTLLIDDRGRVVVHRDYWIVKDDGFWVMEPIKFHAAYEAAS